MPALSILILLTPRFNMAATMAFLDPFRAASHLTGQSLAQWVWLSEEGGLCEASNGGLIQTEPLTHHHRADIVLMSSSWSPERYGTPRVQAGLRHWARQGALMVGLDTGAFVLAEAGLLAGRAATMHYEHMDSFGELYPDITLREDLWVRDGPRLTICGGLAASDCALALLAEHHGPVLARATSRYLYHPGPRPATTPQNAAPPDHPDAQVPPPLRRAIAQMEAHLETPLPIADIAAATGVSQRQLNRLFQTHVGQTAQLYYRDIRLDRARALVTQTKMPLAEVALASGFASQVHFSRAYRNRFGLQPRKDRVAGARPLDYRPWPLPDGASRINPGG